MLFLIVTQSGPASKKVRQVEVWSVWLTPKGYSEQQGHQAATQSLQRELSPEQTQKGSEPTSEAG